MSKTSLNIMVLEAQTIGSVAVIRSLGRAGHTIYSVGSNIDSIGFYSKFSNFKIQNPPYDQHYITWLRQYILEHNIELIIPSEGFLLAVESHYDELSAYLPIKCDKETTYKGMCKWELFNLLQDQEHLPKHFLIDKKPPSFTELNKLSPPFFLKLDEYHKKQSNSLPNIIKCDNVEIALECIQESLIAYDKVLVQQYVKGIGCGVFFLIWDNKLIAQFMHKRIHEVPHTGGASSLRKSWWHENIFQDAKHKVETLGWQGVVMVEYRWDPETDEFYLMEMNCRFWGSLHLALYANVDFPALLVECFQENKPDPVLEFPNNIYCRYTFPREVQYVWSRLKDKEITFLSKLRSIFEFFNLCLNPKVMSDYSFPKDRTLFWTRLKMFLKTGN